MPSIGNITVKRVSRRHFIAPISTPIVQGPSFPSQVSTSIPTHPLLTIMQGTGGGVTPTPIGKHITRGIIQSIVQSSSVTRLVTAGVLGVSYTATSYTALSWTIAGNNILKGLTETVLIGAGTVTRSAKIRRILEPEIHAVETSGTISLERQKTRAASESVNISEQLEADAGVLRGLSETIIVSDSTIIQREKHRSPHAENIGVDDILALQIKDKQTLTESVDVSDSVAIEVTKPGKHITRTLTQSVTIGTSVARNVSATRGLSQSVITSHSVVREIEVALASFTNTSFTDISFTTTVRAEKTLTETVEQSHTVGIQRSKNRALSETIELSDEVTSTKETPDVDSVEITDQLTRQINKSRGLSESVTIIG